MRYRTASDVPDLPSLKFDITHQGLDATSSLHARRRFGEVVRTAAHAAAGVARWPHYPNGLSRVTKARVVVAAPKRCKLAIGHPMLRALEHILAGVLFDDVDFGWSLSRGGVIALVVYAVTIVETPDAATRAALLARTEMSTPREPLAPGQLTPAEEYERSGVHIPPPEDSIERQMEAWEAEEAKAASEDPNAVSNLTLQREERLGGGARSSSKGRKRTAVPGPSASELADQFDARSRELDMLHLTDIERATLAVKASAKRIENSPRGGRPLKGSSPRIKIRERVPADLLVACSVLGPDVESILMAAARAIRDGTIYIPPAQTDAA